jgi:hypothetical protein
LVIVAVMVIMLRRGTTTFATENALVKKKEYN